MTDASTIPPASDGSGPEKPIDLDRIERAVREILEAIGEDPDRDGLVRTPLRIAKMYEEIFAGIREDPSHHLTVTFEAEPRRDGDGPRHPAAFACVNTISSRSPGARTSRTSPAPTAASPGCRRSPGWSTGSPNARRCRSG